MMLATAFLVVEILSTTVATDPECVTEPLPSCDQRNLSITVDNTLRLFIDGVESTNLPNANDWTKADSVPLSCYARVIAVLATDDGAVRAGIIASTADGFVKTNDAWKCTSVYQRGWETVGFDDSSWPSAREIAVHRTFPCPWMSIDGINKDAYWIWTDNFVRDITGDRVVYCRKTFPVHPDWSRFPRRSFPPCPTRSLSITVDNYMVLYLDGVQQTGLPNANDWTKADIVPVQWNTRVIAVQGTDDRRVRAGILASTGDGYVLTNDSWKCTNVLHSGWQSVTYDDSAWPSAYAVAIHQTYPCPPQLVPNIRRDAYWIWTDKYESGAAGDVVVYCRLKLDKDSTVLLPS